MADRGFSLLEFLIVVIILCIAATMAAPNFSRLIELYTVRKAARQLVSDLQFTKMRAVAEGTDHRVSFVSGGTPRYVVERDSGGGAWVTIDIVRDLADPANPYYSKGISMNTATNPLRIVFSPLGSVNPAASIIFCSSSNQSKTVRIILTGRIRIE